MNTNNLLIVDLRGGIGNQLFQYAFARKLQTLNPDKQVYLSIYNTLCI
jgi:hypothetical protein